MQKNTFGVCLLSHEDMAKKFDYSAKIKVAWIDSLLGKGEAFVDMLFHLNIPIEIINKKEKVELRVFVPLNMEKGSLICLHEVLRKWPFAIHDHKLEEVAKIVSESSDTLMQAEYESNYEIELLGLPENSVLYGKSDYSYFNNNEQRVFFGIQEVKIKDDGQCFNKKHFGVEIGTGSIYRNLEKVKILTEENEIKSFPLYFSFRYKVEKSSTDLMRIDTLLGRTVNFYFNTTGFLRNDVNIIKKNTIQPLSCKVCFLLTGQYALLDSKGKWAEKYKEEECWEWHHIDEEIDAKMNMAYLGRHDDESSTLQHPYYYYLNERKRYTWRTKRNHQLNQKRINQTIAYEYEFEASKNENWQTFQILFRAKRPMVINKILLLILSVLLVLNPVALCYVISFFVDGWWLIISIAIIILKLIVIPLIYLFR